VATTRQGGNTTHKGPHTAPGSHLTGKPQAGLQCLFQAIRTHWALPGFHVEYEPAGEVILDIDISCLSRPTKWILLLLLRVLLLL